MIQTYKNLKGRTWDKPGIPKWIFRTGNESVENLNAEIAKMYTSQLENNPNYELFYFSNEDKSEFINDLNNFDIKNAYDTLIPPAYKADLFKFVIAHTYGGVCMDFSMESLVPLDDILKDYTQVLAKDTDAPNGMCVGFIASVKGTLLLQTAIEKCIYNVTYKIRGVDPLDVTGPTMFGDIYKKLNNVEDIPVGKITDSLYLHNMADQVYIYDGTLPIIKIRSDNHYSILYDNKKDNDYYAHLWANNRVYTSTIKTFEHLKNKKWEGDGIPKWIFKTGSHTLENLPELIKMMYLDILAKNPGYELFYFSNEDCMLSIHHHYGEEYFRLHQKLVPTAYQADFWRYCILHTYGGCYGDFSQVPLVQYDELTKGVDRVFVRDDPSNKSFLYNAVMCVKAGDDVVTRAIEISAKNIKDNNYGIGSLDITGPTVLGQAFLQRKFNLNPNSREISLGKYKGSSILQHNPSGTFIRDENGKNVFVTKVANHSDILYGNKHITLHYDQAWHQKRVYKY